MYNQEKIDNIMKLIIITYHYIKNFKKEKYKNLNGLDVLEFRKQIDYIEKNFEVISFEQLENKNFKTNKNKIILTFDDGYYDHYSIVFKELKKIKMTGYFFPVIDVLEKKRILDEKELAKQEKLEQKRRIKEEKELAKQAKLEQKRRIKKEKELAKQEKLEEEKIIQEEKELAKQVEIDEKKIIKKNKKSSKQRDSIMTTVENNEIDSSSFEKLVEKINKRNSLKPYPEINDIPN